jgi:hypothetical protein
MSSGASFVAAGDVQEVAEREGVSPSATEALVEDYEEAQLDALKLAFLAAAALALASLYFTRNLPTERFDELAAAPPAAAVGGAD